MPDPSCNPYLAFAVMLAAGLDGIGNQIDPGPPVNRNVFGMTAREKEELNIRQLPGTLYEALQELKQNEVMRDVLGDHIFDNFIQAKEDVWWQYQAEVHQWELDRYLGSY